MVPGASRLVRLAFPAKLDSDTSEIGRLRMLQYTILAWRKSYGNLL